ncbi:MAG: hypothetical protein IJG63_08730, partial [Oscillospiraceae bacterium]|nr:hypothetical protein [Oscillospiraceae bacterium]
MFPLIAVGIALYYVLPRNDGFVAPLVLLASLALCPIFTDIAEFVPLLGKIRWLFPPCWFYSAMGRPIVWLSAGLAATVL